MPERVAITGIGVVTPVGTTAAEFAAALREGRNGVRTITAFPAAGFETRIAAEVDGAFDPSCFVEPRKATKLMSRAVLFAVAAAAMARDDAGLAPGDVDPDRLAVSLGAGGMGPVDLDALNGQHAAVLAAARECGGYEKMDLASFARAYRALTNPIQGLRALPNAAAAQLAIQQNARGPNNTFATACTSGTQAIGEAMRLLRAGAADVVLAGGTDAMVNPVGVLGFNLLGTLSRRNEEPERASRPFDLDRDGFVIGEGAGILVLEREAFAHARGARILAEAAGYGVTCDAYRITDERPDAAGATAAIQRCLQDACATAADVHYVNAHATSTRMNDKVETRAIRQALGAHAQSVPVSATKSMIGHLVAAAGAVECAACVIALTQEFLPPTINHETPDPECDLDYVPNQSRPARIATALSNSFGFGGQNACLMIRRW